MNDLIKKASWNHPSSNLMSNETLYELFRAFGDAKTIRILDEMDARLSKEHERLLTELRERIEKRIAQLKKDIDECDNFLDDDYDQQTVADRNAYQFAQKELEKILTSFSSEVKQTTHE
ncbi:MAG: hypothetical protein KGN01_06855 [Patescibacteria group bacterium]|nr:hypothetical protein [Patescibacteria group bacterium]